MLDTQTKNKMSTTACLAWGYTYADRNYIVRGPTTMTHSFVGVVCDKADQEIEERNDVCIFFNKAHKIFVDRIMKLAATDHCMTADEEKELRFMFDAVLSAKGLLSDAILDKKDTKKKK